MTAFQHMISRETLERLLAEKESPLISLYLPLHQEGSDARENERILNAALTGIEQRLGLLGLSPKGCAQFLAPARAYAQEHLNLPHAGETIALFLSPSIFRAHVLPGMPSECVVIGPRFHITPLLPYLRRETQCYVLTVSKKHAKLLHATEEGMVEVDVPDMPHSVKEAWQGMERDGDDDSQSHASGHGLVTHGHGGAKDVGKMEVEEYIKKLTKSLDAYLSGKHVPLVFAGVEMEWGMFRKSIRYAHVVEEYLHGNPDDYSYEELYAHAVPLLHALWDQEKKNILAAYGELSGTGRTSTDLQAIVDLSHHGKVEILLLQEGAQQWGSVENDTGVVQLHERQQEGDSELFGIMASQTLEHRGWVATLPADQMPEGARVAAMLRY